VRLDILLLKEDGTPGARGSVNFSMHSKRYWKNDFGVTTRRRRSDKVSSIRLRSPGYLRQGVLTVVGEPHPPRPIPIRRSPEPGRIDLIIPALNRVRAPLLSNPTPAPPLQSPRTGSATPFLLWRQSLLHLLQPLRHEIILLTSLPGDGLSSSLRRRVG
jgi:hypothetical protein